MNIMDYRKTSSYLNTAVLTGDQYAWPVNIYRFAWVIQTKERTMDSFMPYAHQHYFMELHVPIRGTQTYEVRKESYQLKPLDALLIGKDVMHSITAYSDDLQKIVIGFLPMYDNSPMLHWLNQFQNQGGCRKFTFPAWSGDLLARVIEEASGADGNDVLLYCATIELLAQMGRAYDNPPVTPATGKRGGFDRVNDIEKFIDDNISMNITNRMLTDHIFLSVRQMDRLVLAQRGVTVKQLIERKKAEQARALLSQSDLSNQDIAQQLGFSESSSFCRYFKRVTGLTPGEYRRQALFKENPAQTNTP